MKVIKIQQNSEEWFEYRRGKSGGSGVKDLWTPGLPTKEKIIQFLEKDGQKLTPADKSSRVGELAAMLEPEEIAELKLESDPKRGYYELIAEGVARDLTPNDYVDKLNGKPFSMMERGHILEPEAKEAYERLSGKKLDAESVVWQSDYNPDIFVSPDGAITDPDGKVYEAVEVKCLSSWEIVKAYLTNQYPQEYKPQVIKYFSVNEDLKVLHFLLYTDLIPGLELQVFDIKREDVEDQIADLKAFETAIMKRVAANIEKIRELGF